MRTFSGSDKLAMLLGLIGVAMELVATSGKTREVTTKDPYAIVGAVCTLLALLIVILAYFRNRPTYR